MDLDSVPEPGVVEIRGTRRAAEVLLGYLFPLGVVVAVLTVVLGAIFAPSPAGLFFAYLIFVAVLLAALVPYVFASRRQRQGRDFAAGLPMAELGPTGARLRYQAPSMRDRRAGRFRRQRYDAAVAWADVTGWRRGIDLFGGPVLILEIDDPDRVTVRPGSQLGQVIRLYVGEMRETLGSAAVIRIRGEPAEAAAVAFLKARWLDESASIPPPTTWPVDGKWLVRRGVAETSGDRAWPARSLPEILGFRRSGPDRR